VTDPHQSDTEPTATPRRPRRPPTWLVGAGVVLAVIGAVVLLRGHEADEAVPRDLSTPEGAAAAFASAASTGDVDGLLAATCLGNAGCAAEHGGGLSAQQITTAKKILSDNAGEIGARLRHAEFTTARTGTQHNTREVDYRLPGVSERSYLVFVHYQDRWLYIATGGPTTATPATAPPT
jgi:hypothetical protein